MFDALDLNGSWKLRWSDGQRGRPEYANRNVTDDARYIDAQVPGEVHLDLWRAGLIADPYAGANCLAARWVEECLWSYRREFDAPDGSLDGPAWLAFDGLDLVASVVLNGVEVGRHDNAFYPCRVDVTGKLRPGRNVLAVHLDGGLFDVADKRYAGYRDQLDTKLHKRHWLRKPQCQFGWDWSTRLINVGIFKPVRLEWTSAPARLDQVVPLVTVSDDLNRGSVVVRVFVEGLGGEVVKGKLVASLAGGPEASADIEVKPGLHPYEVKLDVERPQLWWPVGHGEQRLYELGVSASVGGQSVGQRVKRVGFRHVRVNQDAHPERGRYFVFEVNGRPIFCKGANFVPADMIFARLDRARYDALTDLALEANFNFLRVWGGGLYENDEFFELCDRKGILVWQEFIFACSRYPTTDQAFYDNVKREAVHNIRRLASHPSLVAWCGNNENEQGNWDWGFDKDVVLPDYALFHLTLPRLMKQEDPTRYYQPSSPFSPDGEHPTADHIGDQHPWSIGFANTDFREYRQMISRFPNEGGTLGPTSLPTMLECLPEGPQRKVGSFAWQVHDNSVDSWGEPSYPDEMIRQWLGKDPRQMTVEQFTYYAGILQGEGLREYVDNFRRRAFSSSGAIFWMYNDCWPAVRSWTIVDYRLRRTPSFHPVRRAMAPLGVVVTVSDGEVTVYGVNDTPHDVNAELRYGLFEFAGGLPIDRSTDVRLMANASTELASFPRSQWAHPDRSAAFAILSRDGEPMARNRLILPRYKDLAWPRPELRVRVDGGTATFESSTFAWNVCLDLNGGPGPSDNFFDIYPGIPHRISWPDREPPRILYVGNLAR